MRLVPLSWAFDHLHMVTNLAPTLNEEFAAACYLEAVFGRSPASVFHKIMTNLGLDQRIELDSEPKSGSVNFEFGPEPTGQEQFWQPSTLIERARQVP